MVKWWGIRKLILMNKLFKKCKKLRLHIDRELYKKKSKYDVLNLFEEKLSETIGKPKEFWESLKSLCMPNKTLISNFNAIEENDSLTYNKCSIFKIF